MQVGDHESVVELRSSVVLQAVPGGRSKSFDFLLLTEEGSSSVSLIMVVVVFFVWIVRGEEVAREERELSESSLLTEWVSGFS